MPRTIMWFRRDLRLADNEALAAAATGGEVVPLFVVDPVFAVAGAARQAYLRGALDALDDSMGRALVYRHGDPVAQVVRLAAETGATSVVAAADFGPYGRARDAAVAAALAADGRSLRLIGSPYAVDPGVVRKGDGTPYAVFTPFCRVWERQVARTLVGTPEVRWHGAPAVHCEGPPPAVDPGWALPAIGEAAAWARADSFLFERLRGYPDARNDPSIVGTSLLSADLRWGVVHPSQLLVRLGPDDGVFRSELAWREFYADVLFHQPRTARWNLNRAMDRMVVDDDGAAEARFEQWCRGETGYPIVDAGMRQLNQTGWMHNRVRMIVASFLVKDLHLPWQWGARYFMRHLIDGDLASNSHGWQWTAGTGTDAAPYFRIFNPVSQAERYDPQGDYVRRWVPELAHLPAKAIHAPWTSKQGTPLGYVPPMVDHNAERAESLRRYSASRAG